MRLGQAAAVTLVLLASPGAAQEAKRTDELPALMPKELGGAPGVDVGEGIRLYPSAKPGRDPMIGVTIIKSEKVVTPAEMRSHVRDRHRETGIRQIMREGTFTTRNWPGAGTFFGEYETGGAFNQTWMMSTGKQNVIVTVTYFPKVDAKRAEAEVAEKIFGGAVISAHKPAE